MNTCEIGNCKKPLYLIYNFKDGRRKNLCEDHWKKQCNQPVNKSIESINEFNKDDLRNYI